MSDDIPLVPGEIRAYRLWHFTNQASDNLWTQRRRLESTGWYSYLDPAPSRERRPYQAVCNHVRDDGKHQHDDPVDECPTEHCTCGYYGTFVGGLLYAHQMVGWPVTKVLDRPDVIAGSVLLSGRVIFGARGVARAQYMRPEALFSLSGGHHAEAQDYLREAQELYSLPGFTNPIEFEQAYPLAPDLLDMAPDAEATAHLGHGVGAMTLYKQQELARYMVQRGLCMCTPCLAFFIESGGAVRKQHAQIPGPADDARDIRVWRDPYTVAWANFWTRAKPR